MQHVAETIDIPVVVTVARADTDFEARLQAGANIFNVSAAAGFKVRVCDPATNANAVKFDAITYDEVLKRRLAVMDSTATSLSMDNHIPVLVFALKDPYNIVRALRGEKIGTIVKEA